MGFTSHDNKHKTLNRRRTRRQLPRSIVRLVASRAAMWADGMHDIRISPNDPY